MKVRVKLKNNLSHFHGNVTFQLININMRIKISRHKNIIFLKIKDYK